MRLATKSKWTLFLVFVSALLLTSCADDDDAGGPSGTDSDLVGIWQWSDLAEVLTIQFSGDGTWRLVQEAISDESCVSYGGTWIANENAITLRSASGGSSTTPYVLTDNVLQLETDPSYGSYWTFDRLSSMTSCSAYPCGEGYVEAEINGELRHYGGGADVYWNGSANTLNVYSTDFVAEGLDIASLPMGQTGTFTVGTGSALSITLASFFSGTDYRADSGTGSGSVTITSVSDSCVAGTFEGHLIASNSQQEIEITNGEFSVRWVVVPF